LSGPGAGGSYPGIPDRQAAAEFQPALQIFPGIHHAGHAYHYREPGHTLEKREISPGPPASGIQPEHRTFLTFSEDANTLNMFVKENRELFKKIRTVINRYYLSRERHSQILMVKKTDSITKSAGDLLISQSVVSSQPGLTAFYPGASVFTGSLKGAANANPLRHALSREPAPPVPYRQVRPDAAPASHPGPSIVITRCDYNKFPRGSQTLNTFVYTNPGFPGETRFPGEMSHPVVFQQSLTSSVINNITRKYTASPEDIHRLFPTAPVPDLYYSNPMKGVGSHLEESRTVTTASKSLKNLEETGPAPVKPFGQDQAGAFKKAAVDMDRLTDQVFRKLERKITIEKERRGW
jgi:hypothetical protein